MRSRSSSGGGFVGESKVRYRIRTGETGVQEPKGATFALRLDGNRDLHWAQSVYDGRCSGGGDRRLKRQGRVRKVGL